MKFLIAILSFLLLSSCANFSFFNNKESNKYSNINDFFEESYEKESSLWPTWQTYLGKKDNQDKLNTVTPKYVRKSFLLEIELLKELGRFDYKSLSNQEKLSYDIFKYNKKLSIEGYKWRYHSYPINQMFGFHSDIPSLLINMHQIDTLEDAKAFISRVKDIQRYFKEEKANLRRQRIKGIYPPKFVYKKAIEDSKNIISGIPFESEGEHSAIYETFIEKITKLTISPEEMELLKKEIVVAMKEFMFPAYVDLISFLEKLDKSTKHELGVWKLPRGDEYYRYKLKSVTSTDMTAEEIHQLGLSEVKRIHEEMEKVKKRMGYRGTLLKFFDYMKTNPQFFYSNTKRGKQAYLNRANKVIAEMKEFLPNIFHTLPKAELVVKQVEPYREKTAGMAFYNGPSLEGNRPGIYYVNLSKMTTMPRYELEALAYHEALPGHHMQISIAQELTDLPKFRRTGGGTAYIEGWGLYSELLPKEYGFYKRAQSDFGRLSMELWRACRLVVDTGLHAKRWTKKKAIYFLKRNTPNSHHDIVKAVERYLVLPGQAVAYKVGMLKILDLREKAKNTLGDGFDIRDFHDVILRNGPLPLGILEKQVDQYIYERIEQINFESIL